MTEEKQGTYKGHTKNYVLIESNSKHQENMLEQVVIKEATKHHVIQM